MKVIGVISRIFVGLVFIFSGFVKAVDPMGTVFKLGDYFGAFGMSFFSNVSAPLAIILISLEFIVGIVMVLGIRMKFFSWVLLILMSYFLVLTLIIAITNPVTDCGCFGDFLVISNWQTFYKNIVLMGLTIIIFMQRNHFQVLLKTNIEWGITISVTIAVLAMCVVNLNSLPTFDFRPFHIGAHIPSKMEVPEDAPQAIIENIMVYEKDGVQKEFNESNYPWKDTTWHWIETKQNVIQEGTEPEIHDFVLTDNNGEDYTSDILYNDGYTFLLISYKIDQKKISAYEDAEKLKLFCDQNDWYSFYAASSALNSDKDLLSENANISYDFLNADETMLKTIIRSKPGLILLKEGMVVGKWHYNNFPDPNEFNESYLSNFIDKQRTASDIKRVIIYLIGSFIVLVVGRVILKKI